MFEHELAARVVRIDRGRITIQTIKGTNATALDRTPNMEPIVVGDHVTYARLEVPHDGVDLVVTEVAQRHGVLKRRAVNATSQHRVIAVNVDVALVCEPLNSPLNQRRVERMVTIALAGGITPVVILTKTDLADDLAADIAAARKVAPTARVIASSAIEDADDVRAELATVLGTGVTAVLFGPSGAGKSTLVNALFDADKQLVRDIRASGYGRHTTTASTLLDLPSGGCIIDTPGVRDLGVAEAVEAVD
ncbi:MAG: GTPase RsgA, partial [Thermoleophilia bacterium]|nr:GTPase RsgA [Thermoleophilia bacterium]